MHDAFVKRRYRPRHPFAFDVEKPGGGQRTVCIYQVADSALSKMLFTGILKKNLPLMSSRSYAYRPDISAQNAIQYIQSEFKGENRLYVAEYDFSKYFDTIEHDHIRRVLSDRFLLTEVERQAIEGFLRVGFSHSDYSALDGPERKVGVPQGTSISLFLANVAAWELDRALEGEGVRFVRYADDGVPRTQKEGRCRTNRRMRCCMRDEGAGRRLSWWPFAVVLQGKIANHREVRRSRAGVPSVAEKARLERVRCGFTKASEANHR